MKTDKTEIDKTVLKIRKLINKHYLMREYLELDKITDKSFNLYLVGRFDSGYIYEKKYIDTIRLKD